MPPRNPADNAPSAPTTRGPLAALALAMLLSSLGTSIANVALPTLAITFGATFAEVQWVVLSYLLGVTTSIVGAGRLGDLHGRRRLLAAGLLLFVVAAAAGGLAPSLGVLTLARGVQGVGAAVLMALTLAFVADIVPKGHTGRAMGMLGATSAIGTALGPSLGGLLTAELGWRSIFLVQVPLGLLALWLLRRHLPAGRRGEAAPFDLRGTLLLGGSLAALSLALTLGRGEPGLLNLVGLAVAGVGAALFVAAERRAPSPLVPLGMLREPGLLAGLGRSLLVSAVLMATLVVGPFYLSRGLGLAPGEVGLVMAVGPLVAALTGLPAGRLVDQLGAEATTLAGLVGVGLGAAALALTPAPLGVAGYLGPVALLTAGYALFQTANNTAVLQVGGPARRGLVSGLLTLSRNLGLVTGAALMGAVFAAGAGQVDLGEAAPEAVARGLHLCFALGAGLVLVALGLGVRSPAATAAGVADGTARRGS